MAANRKINCPACGFSISADSRSCDFCGYEFETDIDEKPSASAFKSELAPKQAENPGAETQKKNVNGKKKGNNKTKPATADQKPEDEQVPAAAPAMVSQTPVQPAAVNSSTRSAISAEDRIKELERQLSEAENELDVISKILVDQPKEMKQESAPGAASVMPATSQAAKSSDGETQRRVTTDRQSIQTTPNSSTAFDASKKNRTPLHLKFRALNAVSIAIGVAVYVASVFLSSSLGSLEEYFLMFSGAVLITLGLYASIETAEIEQRQTVYHG